MQKGSLLLFVASLGIAWVHASTTSAGYCCPQITVALGTEDDGTYTFMREGNGPASDRCQNACLYSRDSNKTAIYCFEAVTSDELGSGQVQCEAVSPYSLPAVTGPTPEELLKKIEDLEKVVGQLNTEKTAVCGTLDALFINTTTTLTFKQIYNEVNSGLGEDGYFTAPVSGVYFVDLKTSVQSFEGQQLLGFLQFSSGNYRSNYQNQFISTSNDAGGNIGDQASGSRYVTMSAGDTLHISLLPRGGQLNIYRTIMCVSLYSTSG